MTVIRAFCFTINMTFSVSAPHISNFSAANFPCISALIPQLIRNVIFTQIWLLFHEGRENIRNHFLKNIWYKKPLGVRNIVFPKYTQLSLTKLPFSTFLNSLTSSKNLETVFHMKQHASFLFQLCPVHRIWSTVRSWVVAQPRAWTSILTPPSANSRQQGDASACLGTYSATKSVSRGWSVDVRRKWAIYR